MLFCQVLPLLAQNIEIRCSKQQSSEKPEELFLAFDLISFFNSVDCGCVILKWHITEKVFAKCGLDLTESSIQTERSKMLFQIVKLQIKSR